MTDNMKKFMDLVSENAELAAKVSNMDKAALIAEAQKQGIALTEADFTADKSAELSEDELGEVAGGKCSCLLGGAGEPKNDHSLPCGCTMEGNGLFTDIVRRCSCAMIGHGVDT